jgi:hemerythrin superfamily protein
MRTKITDIAILQRQDHTRLLELMGQYEAAATLAKPALYDEIRQLVTTHAFAEEAVLFPAARWIIGYGEALTAEIEAKHQRINELMLELEDDRPGDPVFEDRVSELFPLLRDDLKREEDELMPALASGLSATKLRAIGLAWSTVKSISPNRAHPRVSRRPPGNALAAVPLAVYDRLIAPRLKRA